MAEFSVTRSLREGVSITLSRTGAAIVGIIIVAELAEFSFNKYLGVKTPLSYIFWILDNPSRLLNHVTAGQLAYHDMFFVLIGVLLAPVPPLLILRACYSKLCQLDRLSLNSIFHRIGHTLLLSAALAGLFMSHTPPY